MKISVIVNTCCLGPRAHAVTGSCSPTPHAWRAFALGNFILPAYAADANIDEVIVAGEFVQGDGFTYAPSPSRFFSCVDALAQRDAGAKAANGDILIFTHDDHILEPGFAARLRAMLPLPDGVGVIVPQRRRRTFASWNVLNNGRDQGYIGGHVVVMTRAAAEAVPWSIVAEVHEWDKSHTQLLRDAGFGIRWLDDLAAYDIEIGVTHEGSAL